MNENIGNVLARRDAVTKRIIDHLQLDSKERALSLITGWMSISDLESIAEFWDERLSPEENAAIDRAKSSTTVEKLGERITHRDLKIARLERKIKTLERQLELGWS